MAPHTKDGARRKLRIVNDAMPSRLPMMSQRYASSRRSWLKHAADQLAGPVRTTATTQKMTRQREPRRRAARARGW